MTKTTKTIKLTLHAFICVVMFNSAVVYGTTMAFNKIEESTKIDKASLVNNDLDLLEAGLVHPNGKIYFFRRVFYHAYDFNTKKLLEVNRIGSPSWKGLDVSIDAAMTDKVKNQAFLFKGNFFYRYSFSNRKVVEKGIVGQDNFQGLTGPFDAACWINGGEVGYFFKEGQFFLWSAKSKRVIQRGKIGEHYFKGVPKNPDLVLLHPNKKFYFFKDDMYYRYDSNKKQIDKRGRIGKDEWPNVFERVDAVFDAQVKSWREVKYQLVDLVKGKYVYLSTDYWPSKKKDKGNWFTNLPIFVQSPPEIESAPLHQNLQRFTLGYQRYPGTPADINAICYNDKAKETLFFKLDTYYVFDNRLNKVKAVGKINRDDYKGVPFNVDAAFFQGSFIWFFKGNKYYKYMPKMGKVLRDGYIRTYFKGVPDNLDGAVLFHGKIRFYKKTIEYIYDQNKRRVVETNGVK